ncbi:MAG: NusG domain II-containing protein [Eubacteriales bacterium]|nr:NusG domain II-containing protein [Eubacteriales bacterium]
MPDNSDLQLKKGDAFAAAFIIVCAVVFGFLFSNVGNAGETPIAQIYLNGRLVREASLGIDAEFTVEGEYSNTVTVKDGKIFVSESSCPGQDCVHTGPLGRSGGCIVCLPNRMEIRLTSGTETDISVR